MFSCFLFLLSISLCTAQEEVLFRPVQPEVFQANGAQAIAWADYDNDGDLDAAVSFKNRAIRLYKNTEGQFEDLAAELGFSTAIIDTRSLSWGDYNQDGWLDLYVGYGRDTGIRNALYENRNGQFNDVAAQVGVNVLGTTRQVSWIDYDNDGDSDLYISMRDRANILLKNIGGSFENVSSSTGMSDPRRTVASLWFDMDMDGDLDLFLANQSGDRDGFYRNDNGYFTDIAADLEMDFPRRPLKEGSVGVAIADYDNDGDFDLFVGLYGTDVLYQNDGSGNFTNVAEQLGLDASDKVVGVDWADYDNDGFLDLYVVAYKSGVALGYDKLYHQENGKFVNRLPKAISLQDGDHGVRWADYDNDGDLDLWLANRHKNGQHQLFRNDLEKSEHAHSFKILILDENGHYTRQGAEVRLYDSKTKALLGSRIVDTGGGYVSQNAQPVHFGLGQTKIIDIEVTYMSTQGRQVKIIEQVDVVKQKGALVIKGF